MYKPCEITDPQFNSDYRVTYRNLVGTTDTTMVVASSPTSAKRGVNWALGRDCAIDATPVVWVEG